MGKRKKTTSLETTPDLEFVKSGRLNLIVHRSKDDGELIGVPANSAEFLEDRRLVKSSNMDQITFQKEVIFKVTLDFMDYMECEPETAVRECTDWMLCSCEGAHAFYSKVEERLVLQKCKMSLQSTIEELELPFIVVLLFDGDDVWEVERVLR